MPRSREGGALRRLTRQSAETAADVICHLRRESGRGGGRPAFFTVRRLGKPRRGRYANPSASHLLLQMGLERKSGFSPPSRLNRTTSGSSLVGHDPGAVKRGGPDAACEGTGVRKRPFPRELIFFLHCLFAQTRGPLRSSLGTWLLEVERRVVRQPLTARGPLARVRTAPSHVGRRLCGQSHFMGAGARGSLSMLPRLPFNKRIMF